MGGAVNRAQGERATYTQAYNAGYAHGRSDGGEVELGKRRERMRNEGHTATRDSLLPIQCPVCMAPVCRYLDDILR